MKRAAAGMFGILLLAMAVLGTRVQEGPARRAFTATMHEVRFGAGGVPGYEETYLLSVRSDGSTAKVVRRRSRDAQWYEMRVVLDVLGRRRVSIDPITRSTTTYFLSESDINLMSQPDKSCISGVETDDVLGYKVRRVTSEDYLQEGASHALDALQAPDLDCFALRERSVNGPRGSRSPYTEVSATAILVGEPDPVAFEVPRNYVERTPSQVAAEYNKKFGIIPPQRQSEVVSRLDATYKSRQ